MLYCMICLLDHSKHEFVAFQRICPEVQEDGGQKEENKSGLVL
jgi:hypothetical protein